MSTIRNKIKSEALSQARQTRAKKRQADAKKYNRKANKTDEAIINGNIRQASALRAYGIKKNRAQGNKIYGFDEKDLYNSRSTQLTVGREKNKDKAEYLFTNKKSIIPAGVKKDGSTYDSFTTRKRRLSDTERENFVKYGDTFDKDADKKKYKLFDSANKDADSYLEHFNTGQWDGVRTAKARIKDQDKKGIGKLVEYGIGLGKDILADPVVDAMRVADTVGGVMTGAGLGALENMENALKGHKMEEGLIRKNFKDSLSTSNKTGWSKGSAEFLTEKDVRQFEKDREYFKNDAMLEKIYGTSDLEEFKEKAQKGNNWAGLIWDIIGDPTGLAVNFGKNATKATVKAGKEMLDGTADISTAFKSSHLDDVFTSSEILENKKILDKSRSRKINSELDKSYDMKVNIKEKVSTNPQTPLLSSYLDELDNNLEDKKRISDILHSYDGGDVNEYLEMLDELDDDTYYKVVDMAEKHNPWLYKQMIEGADDIDEMAYDDKVNKLINDSYTKTDDKYTDTKSLRKLSNIPETNGKSLLENYNEFNKSRIGKTYDEIAPRMSVSETKSIFKERLDSFMSLSKDADPIMIESVIKRINNIIEEDTPSYKKAEMLNKMLFGKEDIIRANIPEKTLNDMLEYMSNNLTLTLADKMGDTTADLLRNGTKQTEDIYNHRGLLKLEDKNAMFAPSATDIQYEQKMSDIASYLGVPNKASLTTPRDELKALRKKRVLTTDEYYKLQDLEQQIKKWDDLYKDVANMGDEYAEYSYKKYGKENPLDGFNKIVQEQADMKRAEKLTAHDIEQQVIDELNELGINDLTQKEIDDLVDARVKEYYDEMNHNKTTNHVQQREMSKLNVGNETKISQSPRVEQANLNQVGEIGENFKAQVKSLRKQLNLPETKVPNSKIKLTKGQKLHEIPPAKDSLKGLRRTIEQELEFMHKNPNEYKNMEKAFKQIKTDYVNTLRQIGIPDDKYFHKVKALQDDLKLYYNELTKKSVNGVSDDVIKEFGGRVKNNNANKNTYKPKSDKEIFNNKLNSPLVKMDLQRLARRISETFDEIDNTVLDNISKETPLTKFRPQSTLPDPKYKLTKDKDLINLETGETKPFFDRHTTQEEYNEKIHGGFKQKNIEEYERLQKYVDNPDKYGIYDVMNLMDSMNIKFDPNDAESMDKALNKFFWIIEKKGIVPSSMKNTPQPNKSVKDMRNLPTNELKQLSDETKDLVDNPMSLVENRALQDRNRDEIIDNARKMYERQDKESLFDRLFQQADTREKMKGVKPLFEQVDEYTNSSEGLKQYYTNLAKNDEVIKQLELANKGINPNVKPNKSIFDKLNKNQYSKQVNKDIDKLTKDRAELKNIDKLIGERITPQMVEEVGNKISKSLDDIKIDGDPITPEIRSEMTKEIHKHIDETLSRYSREEQEAIYEGLFQKLETIEVNKNRKPIYEEVDDYLNSLEGLNKYYSNQEINSNVIKKLKLANKGIDVNKATTNKTILDKMAKQMNKHQFDPKTKRNYEEVVRKAIERGEIDEKIAERLTPEMLEKVMNSDKSIFDIKFKSDKQIKAENQANMTRELHKRADDYVAKQDKDTFGIRKKPKKVKQTEDIKPKTKEELLNDELSVDSIGKDIEKDIKQHQKENKPVSFEKFKSWLNNDEAMFYEDTKLYNAYKSWLNSYKKGLTVYNPGWHVQNYFQNKGQNYLALGMDAFKPQTNAKQIIKEIKGKPNKAKNVGKYTPQQIAKMAKDMNIVEGLGADVQHTRGIFPDLENKIDNTPMMKKLMENEKTARLHHFITQIENGMTPEKAMKSVNDTLFDYSKANKVDKVVSDFVDPFWTFHKNNATLMGKSAFSPNSGRLNKVRKFHENLDDMQEKEVEQNYGRLYGNKSFVDDVNGDTYNFLYKEGMMPDIANALPLSQEEVETKLNPILRLLAQQSRGEGNFGNKIVEGDESGWGEVTKDERIGEVIQELNPFMPGLAKTLVKNHNTQKKADDDKQSESTSKKQVFYDWLNYITGFKGNYYREVK